MPWYATLAFVSYAMLLAWQATLCVERGGVGLLAIPYLLVKLLVLIVALAYWDSDLCLFFKGKVAAGIILAGAYILLREAASTLRPVLMAAEHPPQHDNLVLGVGLLAGIVLPALVLFFAGSVALANRCAA
jgi:hypothetical protein